MRSAYDARKFALAPLGWINDRRRPAYLRIPIICDCPDEPELIGISLEGTAWVDRPDRHVGFQLKIDIGGKDYRIARVDWRPRSPHTNKLGPLHLRGKTVETSIHDFAENAALGLELMLSLNLPIAKPIEPEPADFNELLHYIRGNLRLENASDIPTPPWSQQLSF